MRYPLVQGQGNFGSADGDGAAAMRYTEVRLSKYADLLLGELDKGTVKFIPNYDGTHKEPVLLPGPSAGAFIERLQRYCGRYGNRNSVPQSYGSRRGCH